MNRRTPTSSIDTALDLLAHLASEGPQRVTDVASAIGVAKSTAHRTLGVLMRHGFVDQDPDSRLYGLGSALTSIGLAALRDIGAMTRLLEPTMSRLRDQISETVHLVRLEGARANFIAVRESHQALRVGSRVGQSLPAHCVSAGKALLSQLGQGRLLLLYPDEHIETLTTNSIARRDALFEELERIRSQGYAVNVGESEAEVTAVGVAIAPTGSSADVGLAVAAPTGRLQPDRIDWIVQLLLAAKADLEGRTDLLGDGPD